MEAIVTKNFRETKRVGQQFAKSLRGGEVIALQGDLGAGKTTFMQGLATGLGINRNILSPTFIIVRTYALSIQRKDMTLYHVDLYRIETEADVKGLGILELFGEKNTIFAIEWSEKIASLLPPNTIHITLTATSENERKIVIDDKK